MPKVTHMKVKNFLKSIDLHAIIAYTDQAGTITYVNDNFCRISGYSRKELIGQNHRIINSGVHPKEFFFEMWQTIMSGEVWVGEICNRKKNGDIYWVNTTLYPEHSEEGEIVGFFAIRYDITQQKVLEKQNKELIRMNEAVQELAKVGGWELDIETNEVLWTKQTYKIHQVPPTFKIQKELAVEFYIEKDKERVNELVKRCKNTGEKYDEEFQIVTAKGDKIWVRGTGEPVFNSEGKVIKLRGTFQDINEQKLAEIKAKEDRQKFLHSAKLSTLGEMSSSLIHEMSNPLNVISGFHGRLRRLNDLDEIKETLEKMDRPIQRLLKMVRNLRKFSRNEAVEREVKINDLTEIIESSIEYTRHKFRNNHVECIMSIDQSLPIPCESSEMEQIFVNLLNNAVDAVEGNEEKWVEISAKEEAGKGIYLYITDSGHGIEEEIAENIFNSFFTTKDKDKGTGLGLSIVKDLVTENNGTITIDHDYPNTRFVIWFSYKALSDAA